MKRIGYLSSRGRQGSVLILSLIFIVMLSAMAVALATMSGSNVQIAENHRKMEDTRGCAESGLEVIRYWMSKIEMSGKTERAQRFDLLASNLASVLSAAGITNIIPAYSSGSTITMSNVPLCTSRNQSFSAVLTKLSDSNVRLDVTGYEGPSGDRVSRTIRSEFVFEEQAHTVFDFGVASKGPLVMSGNVEIVGVNVAVESNAYIESMNTLVALSMSGKSEIAGNVKIANPSAAPFLGSNASVGGKTGADAMQNIEIGASPSDFPEMAPAVFYSYATNVLTPSVDLKKAATLTNIRIPAGMNPKFSGNATLKGVVLIEAPNVVEFTGGASITGVIVTNGDRTDDSGANQLIFRGHVAGLSVALLPQEPQFSGLQSQTGTFIIAPGFSLSFGGTFDAIGGAIAANGIEFFGNAGGMIQGSVINYANKETKVWGNSSLMFNRSGLTEVPAGFVPEIILQYDPSAYSEVLL